MEYRIVRRRELPTAEWSGGTTTQLAIWPEDASYADRNFTWRVSTARINDEKSEFTLLRGYNRVLMVLEGRLVLTHKTVTEFSGKYSSVVSRFGQTRFPAIPTSSTGRATDFNLMLLGYDKGFDRADGHVKKLDVPAGSTLILSVPPLPAGWTHNDRIHKIMVNPPTPPVWMRYSEVFYINEGEVSVRLPDGGTADLRKGDVVVTHYSGENAGTEISFRNASPDNDAIIIRAGIYYN